MFFKIQKENLRISNAENSLIQKLHSKYHMNSNINGQIFQPWATIVGNTEYFVNITFEPMDRISLYKMIHGLLFATFAQRGFNYVPSICAKETQRKLDPFWLYSTLTMFVDAVDSLLLWDRLWALCYGLYRSATIVYNILSDYSSSRILWRNTRKVSET